MNKLTTYLIDQVINPERQKSDIFQNLHDSAGHISNKSHYNGSIWGDPGPNPMPTDDPEEF